MISSKDTLTPNLQNSNAKVCGCGPDLHPRKPWVSRVPVCNGANQDAEHCVHQQINVAAGSRWLSVPSIQPALHSL